MKVLESINLGGATAVVDGQPSESSMAKDLVFNNVKKLFHLTSNKKAVLQKYVLRKKECDAKTKQCKLIESKLLSSQEKLRSSIKELYAKLEESKKLLKSSLDGDLS